MTKEKIIDIDNAIFNSNRIEEFFDRNSVNVDLKKYFLFLRDDNGENFKFYEGNNVGYNISNQPLLDLLKEVCVGKSIWDNINILSPFSDSFKINGADKAQNVTYITTEMTVARHVKTENLVEIIPKYFNVIVFDISSLKELSYKAPEGNLQMVSDLNELIEMKGFIKIYKKGENFYIYYN